MSHELLRHRTLTDRSEDDQFDVERYDEVLTATCRYSSLMDSSFNSIIVGLDLIISNDSCFADFLSLMKEML